MADPDATTGSAREPEPVRKLTIEVELTPEVTSDEVDDEHRPASDYQREKPPHHLD